MSGTSERRRASGAVLNRLLVVVPPAGLGAGFRRLATSRLQPDGRADCGSPAYATLRDAILPNLFSGGIRASEAGRLVRTMV